MQDVTKDAAVWLQLILSLNFCTQPSRDELDPLFDPLFVPLFDH
jgi:hypothetical protein